MSNILLTIKLEKEGDGNQFFFNLYDEKRKICGFNITSPEEKPIVGLFSEIVNFFDYKIIKDIHEVEGFKEELKGKIISYSDENITDEDKKSNDVLIKTAKSLYEGISANLVDIIESIFNEWNTQKNIFSEE
ncbi:hypothetical protein [Mesoplasma whartonense]|uniref:hypothetical protein n=1 Tax=Mesoplasma whartonense TaxID=2878854 RepID=UPI002022A3D6|nr:MULTISPECIES: hypothetical protein [unclassified Mesoplasma]MCL8212673.1 hypothetical protein [Mesoplasma sp. JKS002661]MCL8216418.1 hypothetical protein [Mesoplasma sp. JKS002657]